MEKQIILTAAVLGALAVILGAFGAHGLKPHIAPAELDVWQTAVQYHFYHVFALLFLSTLTQTGGGLVGFAYYAYLIGIILFSGSLYLLACRYVLGWSWLAILGPVTPLGGLSLICGWVLMAIAAWKQLK
ncbi:DUF423 domain-containing protein [Mucilaginibacter hurinus]|uniref:DUF423 domain-containing protein n=1 Tax=Mucilaginibacter hurinus TaxID=2201324 RepID=A0A367GNY4_9SPHI|nr:DUF423 domain-containing protein [Mucilaginibacter hurinus]RCH55169.1 DUF423 domain-containing protein [Mucilaginibacter hurinus]